MNFKKLVGGENSGLADCSGAGFVMDTEISGAYGELS